MVWRDTLLVELIDSQLFGSINCNR
jgi:hypothetical protein